MTNFADPTKNGESCLQPALFVAATFLCGCSNSTTPTEPKTPEVFRLTRFSPEDFETQIVHHGRFMIYGVGDPYDPRLAGQDFRVLNLNFNFAEQLPTMLTFPMRRAEFAPAAGDDDAQLAEWTVGPAHVPHGSRVLSYHLQTRGEEGVWVDIGEPLMIPSGSETPVEDPYISGNPDQDWPEPGPRGPTEPKGA